MDILAALNAIVADLESAGIPATIDPPDISPPGAWVVARALSEDAPLCRDASDISAEVYLIAPATGAAEAHRHLTGMLTKALTVLTPEKPVSLDESVVVPAIPGPPLPAYKIPVITA